MQPRLRTPVTLLVLYLVALPLVAGVELKVLDDGSLVMYNERSAPRTFTSRPSSSIQLAPAELEESILRHARAQQLDPKLVRAVIQVESGFYPLAESHKGAMGLMQLMPATARDLMVQDPWDPNENLRGGTTYLRHLLDLFGGQLELALAGYNAGPESVTRYGGIPPFEETRSYVEKVLRIYRDDPDISIHPTSLLRRGRKTFLSQDRDGRWVLTTTRVAER